MPLYCPVPTPLTTNSLRYFNEPFVGFSAVFKLQAENSSQTKILFMFIKERLIKLLQFFQSLMPLIADQGPSGASVKQLMHFGQLANNGKWQDREIGER